MSRFRAIVSRVRHEQSGFTMPLLMAVLLVSVLFVFVALESADSDTSLAQDDQDRKRAYSAAEAGVQDYLFHLDKDNAYWSKCTNVPAPAPVNQAWDGAGADPRTWRNVPGSPVRYTIELLPANGFSQCIESQAQQSMIDSTSETFRIRATGEYRGIRRSVIASFRKKGFLDYLYFTDYETIDPTFYSTPAEQNYALANCVKYKRQGRTSPCSEIQFADTDVINGPLHTNDELLICGTPSFGRDANDDIEVSAPPRGWRSSGGSCPPAAPDFRSPLQTSTPILALPPSNSQLFNLTDPGFRFTGTTTIRLNGSSLTVNGVDRGWPANGVLYVSNGACGVGYDQTQSYSDPPGCANVYVSGTYSRDLTIASDRDIVIRPPVGQTNGDVIRSGDVTLGLIANNFIRVYHPVNRPNPNDFRNCTNAAGTMTNVRIDAAILSLGHSFMVDNYACGARLGDLTVNGAIAQKFRGAVGTGGGAGISTGYRKQYGYDDRLHFRNPPHFLSPVAVAWRVARFREQVPAR